MRKIFSLYPFHTFLFIFLICMFLFAHNYEQVEMFMVKRTILYGLLLSAILFGVIYFFNRSRAKAGIISTLLLLLLFNYGVMYDMLESMYYAGFWPFKNIHRYLIGLVIIASFLIILIVQKKVITGLRINYFLNILVIVLILFNGIKILNLAFADDTGSIPANKIETARKRSELPNLYYIVLDGYANHHVLRKYYDFDNNDFINFLKDSGFFIADSSISNYYSTPPSLASTLNMEYLPKVSGAEIRRYVLNNKLFSLLKNNGYSLYNLQSGYSVTNGFTQIDSSVAINGPNEFERGILKFTIFRLDDLFGMMQHVRLKSQFSKLNEMALINKNQKFTFVHIVAPHPPFVFNSKGEHIYNDKSSDNSWEPKKNYIEQLIYVNTIAKKFLLQIIQNDPTGVVILQSDHGPLLQNNNEHDVFEARSMILNAMRYPEIKDMPLKQTISSVNTFRFFVREYLDSTFTLLKDSAAGKTDILNNRLFTDRTK